HSFTLFCVLVPHWDKRGPFSRPFFSFVPSARSLFQSHSAPRHPPPYTHTHIHTHTHTHTHIPQSCQSGGCRSQRCLGPFANICINTLGLNDVGTCMGTMPLTTNLDLET